MQKYQNNIQTPNGVAIPGATVTVQNYPSGTNATIYSDNGITLIPTSQLTTDNNGQFFFYAPDGRYQLLVNGPTIKTPITVTDILLSDVVPSDLPTAIPGTPGKLWNNGGMVSIS